ncbi:hypothetical protein D8674_024261 [Pyrus ussuriensis x Pyrus communis]|uniref:Uncharacterized protein n=1 Tax=Pyrus ussuriensis x Pyrus communis TaxID=2448454 RepID=A0A5N5H2E4_9ROSA|nr:hypothetical protein D8674_024261 [Pyrus ussuriensis x Pyrus communis]
MSLFSMLRRPSYSALSLAVGSAPIFHRVISTVTTFSPQLIRRSFVVHRFSTATATAVEPISQQSLVEVLESEIKCAQDFGVSAFATEILIDSLSVKQPERCSIDLDSAYDGPQFHDLDAELQNAFYKDLEG